ncbi:C40 family peptidase [Streptomyces sp. NPDC020412]|uniref:C40 family peptidase n=1 Tax=Streptomyces sp. NPDC020412 TaxID=3365073 RepID=UPI0037B45460
MSGRLLRAVCTAALAATTTLVAVPTAPPAAAGGPSAARPAAPMDPLKNPADATAEDPADTAAVAREADAESSAAGTPASVPDLLARLQVLYRDSETAARAHADAEAQLTTQRAETARLGRDLTAARAALAAGVGDAGRLAREQYQGHSELSGYVRLLLAPNPQTALDEGHLMRRAAANRRATVDQLTARTQHAEELAVASRKALDRERALVARQKQARDAADQRLTAIERTLAALTPEQIAGITSPDAQSSLGASGALGEPATDGGDGGGAADQQHNPTAAGERAVRFAVEQIGKPYVWGAQGPASYDCSGLTSQAWAAAGRPVPRTSQDQWSTLPRIPVGELRPGDLVLYFADATHVGLYLGDGKVVHAPRPGATVKVSPLTANPLLGAVRPDPEGRPLAAYAPPRLPESATAGSDAGYDGAGEDG